MNRGIRSALVILAAGAVTGCNLLLPFIFVGEHKRTVPAEFHKLEGKRTLVMVWAQQATLFDYPHIRLELATYVADNIAAGVKHCDMVDPSAVEHFLQRDLDAAVDPIGTGKHFKADFVVYVELLEFQIRAPNTPDLVQGRIKASVIAFDLNAEPDEIAQYTLAPVRVLYPEHQPLLMSSRNALLVRRNTYEKFAETVARKFYEHQVDL
ncbi:MAG: hypothetical protein V3W34_14200 [Phycisphaerae bacterium]